MRMSNKTKLNLYAQGKHIATPTYKTATESGGFLGTVTVGGKEYRSKETHSTKKAAENDAAGVALEAVNFVKVSDESVTAKFDELHLERLKVPTEAERPEAQETEPLGAVWTSNQTAAQGTAPGTDEPLVLQRALGSGTPPGPMDADWTKKLDMLNDYCKNRNFPPPVFNISECSSRFTASITIGDLTVQTPQSYGSFLGAKSAVIELAIADLMLPGVVPVSSLQPPITIHSNSSTPQPLRPPSFFLTPGPIPSPFPQTGTTLYTPPLLVRGSPPHPVTPSRHIGIPSGSPVVPRPSSVSLEASAEAATLPQDPEAASKGLLSNYCQKHHIDPPRYSVEYCKDKVSYLATVTVGDKAYRSSTPHEKKKVAESLAAAEALLDLEGRGDGQGGKPQETGRDTHITVGGSSASQGQAVPATAAPLSYKNILQEYAQKRKLATPHYETEQSEDGFKSTVSVTDGSGRSCRFSSDGQQAKKTAEQQAAQRACCELKLV